MCVATSLPASVLHCLATTCLFHVEHTECYFAFLQLASSMTVSARVLSSDNLIAYMTITFLLMKYSVRLVPDSYIITLVIQLEWSLALFALAVYAHDRFTAVRAGAAAEYCYCMRS